MTETAQDSGLFAIEVDADDYAETAAGDTPSTVPRTFQSEADFQAQKASYCAKIDTGNNYEELLKAVPALQTTNRGDHGAENGVAKSKLSKKDVQLLGYAAGEMYYDREYERVVDLCDRVRRVCEVDGKVGESLERWKGRCEERVRKEG